MTVRSHSQVSALVIGVIIGLVAGVLLTVVAFRLLPSPQMVSLPEPLLEAPSGQAYASRVAVSAAGGGYPDNGRNHQHGFHTDTLIVATGTTVTWRNKDTVTHTVTSEGGWFDSGQLEPSGEFTWQAKRPGTITYHCNIHPWREQSSSNQAAPWRPRCSPASR
jgi:plastocyanin